MRAFRFYTLLLLLLLTCAWAGPGAAARTIEFTTTEVTEADVTVSPDGQWLISTMLGHLFRLPVEGGTAEQLTFGPYYDSDPVFSPDGKHLAFVSDRDGSEGNIYVFALASGKLTQVTREVWAARPSWSPDGRSIVYLAMLRDAPVPFFHSWPELVPSLIRRVQIDGSQTELLSTHPQLVTGTFYLSDGRLAAAVVDVTTGSDGIRAATQFEVIGGEAGNDKLASIAGYASPVVPSPISPGVYCRTFSPMLPWYNRGSERLIFVPFSSEDARVITPLSRPRGWVPRFAVTADGRSLYLGEAGRLWKISLPQGARAPLPFRARVQLEVREPVPPPRVNIEVGGSPAPPRAVLDPRLSPDGQMLVFRALGDLWLQPIEAGRARRLTTGGGLESELSFSPRGRHLALIRHEYGRQAIVVFELETRSMQVAASGGNYWGLQRTPDGQEVVFGEDSPDGGLIVAVDFRDGRRRVLERSRGWWPEGRSHFHFDGQALWYLAGSRGEWVLYRKSVRSDASPELVARLDEHIRRPVISPNGKWLAFRRRMEIWIGPLATLLLSEKDIHLFSSEGGRNFVFTADSSALVYSDGSRAWRHSVETGKRELLSIALELSRPVPPPLLIRRARVLNVATGEFTSETSIYVEEGRIRWVGEDDIAKLGPEVRVLEADGRFAIPGLSDMHDHGDDDKQAAFIAYGVTSVRNVGHRMDSLKERLETGERTDEAVPRHFIAGETFHGQWAAGGDPLIIHNERDARLYVARAKAAGVHLIKAYASLPWSLHRVVAEEARKAGLPVVGHGSNGVEEIVKSVTLGYSSLEHTLTPSRPYSDVLQLLAAAGTYWNPTLSVRGGNALLLRDHPERLSDPKLQAFADPDELRSARMGFGFRGVGTQELRGRWVEQLASIREAHERGVKLLAGTDNGFFGASLHWELEYLTQAGIPPLEVLRIATQQAAEAVGAQDDLGTLEPGKLADIVLLDKNPLEDIRNTQTIWRVIKGGWLFDPEKLRPPASIGPGK